MKNTQKYGFYALIVIIFITLSIIRLYNLEGFITFLGDQGRDALIVKRILTLEHLPAIGAPSSVGQIYLGPFYYYLIAPFLFLSGFNPVGLALGVALISIIGTLALWFVIYRNYPKNMSILFLIFIGFSASLVDMARFSWNPNLLPYFAFATILFLSMWLFEKRGIYIIFAGALFSFSVQLHYLALFMAPTIAVAGIYSIWIRKELKKTIFQLLLGVSSFVFFSLPLIIFDLRHNALNLNNLIRLFSEGKIAAESSYFDRLSSTISGALQSGFQLQLSPTMSVVFVIIIFGFTGYVAFSRKSRLLVINWILSVTYILFFALLESPRYAHYYGPWYLSMYLSAASLLLLIKNKIFSTVAMLLIVILFLMYNIPELSIVKSAPNYQTRLAEKTALSFEKYITSEPIQIVTIPFTETDGHYRYFLDKNGHNVLPGDSPEVAKELFVMCFELCKPQDDPQWQIAAFYNKRLAGSWKVENVTIYKIVHGKK